MQPQVVLITGDAGSGKTETLKIVRTQPQTALLLWPARGSVMCRTLVCPLVADGMCMSVSGAQFLNYLALTSSDAARTTAAPRRDFRGLGAPGRRGPLGMSSNPLLIDHLNRVCSKGRLVGRVQWPVYASVSRGRRSPVGMAVVSAARVYGVSCRASNVSSCRLLCWRRLGTPR